jgi:hypothetical protein
MSHLHSRSAKQLHQKRFSPINEVIEEEFPEAMPRHNMPPESYVDERSSVMQLDKKYDTYSDEKDHQFRFSTDPPRSRSKEPNMGDRIDILRESKQDKLKDYLRDRFRPPSETHSQGNRSSRMSSSSRGRRSSSHYDNKKHALSFGIHDTKEEHSLGTFRNSSPKRSSGAYNSFIGPDARARQILMNTEKGPEVSTDLKNRVSFGDNEEFKVSSVPMLNYSDEFEDGHRFGFAKKTPHMKSQKYMNNLNLSHNQYFDVQDVIRENKKHYRDEL